MSRMMYLAKLRTRPFGRSLRNTCAIRLRRPATAGATLFRCRPVPCHHDAVTECPAMRRRDAGSFSQRRPDEPATQDAGMRIAKHTVPAHNVK